MKVCLIVHVCVPVSRLVVSNSCDPLDYSPPGFSVHGIFPARMLEQVAIFSSMGSFEPRDWTHISCISRKIVYHWATWGAHLTITEL